jgi:flagellar hook protein FlgE
MGTALANALSGLRANSQAINIVSGNLANQNTFGYKANHVSFEELVSQSLSGQSTSNLSGASVVPLAVQSFTQGSVTTTGQPYDAAIQGNGFFVVNTQNGQGFTRAGNFKLDSTGHLLTQNGSYVEGWNGVNGVVNTNSPLSDIVVPVAGLRAPTTTTQFSVNLNLNANAGVGTTDATFSSPMQVVDSQGQTHVLTITYTKTAPGTWSYDVTVPSADIKNGVGANTDLFQQAGTLTFDANGNLTSPAPGDAATQVNVTNLADGASDMALTWNFYGANNKAQITQYDQASANLASSQNGTQAGQLTSIAIGDNGQLTAAYTNGDKVPVAQLAVATILNPESMQDLGNNTSGVTSATSVPAIGTPGTGSRGTVTGGAIESSTVDIATEFTNLLSYERGYQANSKVVTTEDQVIQATLSLIQG